MTGRQVDLLRHGEVQGGPCFRGQRDDPLADLGWQQMQGALRDLAEQGARWDGVVSSPAVRCQAFAARFATERHLPLRIDPALSERAFGAWEGRRASDIPLADLSAFWADPQAFTPQDAERFTAFRHRVATAWNALVTTSPGHLLLITHGGVIRVILGEVLGLADNALLLLEVPPACVTRLRLADGDGRPSLVGHWPPRTMLT